MICFWYSGLAIALPLRLGMKDKRWSRLYALREIQAEKKPNRSWAKGLCGKPLVNLVESLPQSICYRFVRI